MQFENKETNVEDIDECFSSHSDPMAIDDVQYIEMREA